MSTDQLEYTELLLDQERQEPLKVLTQHASRALVTNLARHPEVELLTEIDLQTARERAGADSDFSSVNFKMVSGSIRTAQEAGAEVLFFTNEGQDQLGVCARKFAKGHFQVLTPHQIALLVIEILLEAYKKKEIVESGKEPAILRSIALTDALEVQAAYKFVKCIQTYSGLEALGEVMEEYQEEFFILTAVDEANHVLFPGLSPQESIENAINLIVGKAISLKKEGKTLIDFLVELYRQYGFYHEKSFTISRESEAGEKHLKTIMQDLRKQSPDALFGKPVRIINDFYKGLSYKVLNAKKDKINLPKADVLQFIFTDYSKVTFVPAEEYSKLFYHFSVSARIAGKEAFDEEKQNANERIIKMMERIGKI